VTFDAWVYNGSDNLWIALLTTLWEEVDKAYGDSKLKRYTFGIELDRNNKKNRKIRNRDYDAIDRKLLKALNGIQCYRLY
jgi:predicted KAP-like P-loop ATPase